MVKVYFHYRKSTGIMHTPIRYSRTLCILKFKDIFELCNLKFYYNYMNHELPSYFQEMNFEKC